MKLFHMVSALLCCWLILCAAATAAPPASWQRDTLQPNPYDGMPLAEITALPGFVPMANAQYPFCITPSEARQNAESDAPLAFDWIGYILLSLNIGDNPTYVVFDLTGAGVTMGPDRSSPYDEPVPVWFKGTFEYLCDERIIEGYY
jgi:hypothetical protein